MKARVRVQKLWGLLRGKVGITLTVARREPRIDVGGNSMKILRTKKSFRCASRNSLLAVVLIAVILPVLAMGQKLVTGQKASNPVPTSTNLISVDFPAAETVGDVNVVVVGWSDSVSTVSSINDLAGNKYILAAGTNSGNSVSQAIYYAVVANVPTGGALNTITVKFNQNA